MSELKVSFNDYAWPMQNKSYKPFRHQVETVKFMLQNKRAYNFSDLGTGKTLSHLWTADFLLCNSKIKQVLIVTPLSTLKAVWAQEIFLNFPHRKYAIAHGNERQRQSAILSNADFIIINHDGIKIPSVEKLLTAKVNAGDIGLIIIDELTAFKNHTSSRSRAMSRICRANPGVGIHGLTGTPTPNGPTESFGLAKIINPENKLVPKYFKAFKPLVEYQVGPYTWLPTPGAEEYVSAMLQPAIRFNRDDCIDIPECSYLTREVELSKTQKTMYEEMRKELMVEYRDGDITASNAAVKLNKLLQISAGSVKNDLGEVIHLDCKARDDQLIAIFEETGRTKLIVFCAFIASIERTVKLFEKEKASVGAIYGAVDQNVRASLIHQFQNGDLQVLVIQPQSSAHGITLTASNVIVWHSLVASGEIYKQANGRITRAGQTRKQLIYHLIGSPAEAHLLKLQTSKGTSADSVLRLFEDL